jgi:hypothetical protein
MFGTPGATNAPTWSTAIISRRVHDLSSSSGRPIRILSFMFRQFFMKKTGTSGGSIGTSPHPPLRALPDLRFGIRGHLHRIHAMSMARFKDGTSSRYAGTRERQGVHVPRPRHQRHAGAVIFC